MSSVTTRAGVLGPYLERLRATGAPDELASGGRVRPAWTEVADAVEALGVDGLLACGEQGRRLLEDDGVSYIVTDEDGAQARAWALDPLPVVLGQQEWAELARGLTQRAQLLDLVLTDVYGSRRLVRGGLLPAELVLGHDEYVRDADGVRLPGPRQLFLAASDLARDAGGEWRVLGDRTQAPSGLGFAMEDRRVVSRVVPDLYRATRMMRLSPFFQTLRVALQSVAPEASETPRVVLLTPGTHSETAFDQAFLATMLGYPLVEGSDLTVRDGRVWLRALGRLEPVDVVVRRVDSSWCDPLELRPDSRLGVPGLVEAARRGSVAVVNPIGAGVLENPGLLPFLPALAHELLGEDLLLPAVDTFWCGDRTSRAHVLAHLDRMVLRPLSRGQGRSRFGELLSEGERADLARQIETDPERWVGQDPLVLSTAPAVTREGLEPRACVLRTFAVSLDGSYRPMPGGLARVAPTPDLRVVTNNAGAIAKDVWVLGDEGRGAEWIHEGPAVVAVRPETNVSPRIAENLFWIGRYAERAEDVVRLLRTALDRANDFQRGGDPVGAESLRVLLRTLTEMTTTYPGFVGAGSEERLADPLPELYRLLVDPTAGGSVAQAVAALVQAAHEVRDQLSTDTWLALGRAERVLAKTAAGSAQRVGALTSALAQVLDAMLALSGVIAETMVRDPGWRLLDAGRRIERAASLVGLLRGTVLEERPAAVDSLVVESVLVAAESIITYRRRYRDKASVQTVLDLLVLDADNPRALAYQLNRLDEDLRLVPGGGGASGPERVLDRMATRLRRFDSAELARPNERRRAELAVVLGHWHEDLRELSDSVAATHFRHLSPPQPL
ncbi:MAG TPA: circularly permuted type 2 ATP-grasp protein [Actinomycetes bacterium]|nr:circularly permuted type 2 ATP-grasp protein [Actinomycetes bacterium]